MHNAFGHHKEKSRSKKISWFLAALVMMLLLITSLPTRQVEAGFASQNTGGGSPYAVIDAVNAVRSARGLAPFQVNNFLMAAAQGHSEYQASIGSATHTGRGGSDVKSRAVAAGYGGGANVSIVENIYSGLNATPQQAVSWWQGDGIHLETLISTRHTDVGAGAAVSDAGVVYYTLVVGAVSGSGSAGNGGAAAATPGDSGSSSAAPATAVAFAAIQISTPNADGAVIHIVQPGETLWVIAATYDINILDLLSINGLNANSFIVPGQKIVIQEAGSAPTATAVPEETVEKPTRTPRPTATPTQAVTPQANLQPTQITLNSEQAQALDRAAPKLGIDPLLLVIASLMIGGVILVVAGNLMKRAG